MRYLKGTSNYGIYYSREGKELKVFIDSDYSGDLNDGKSTKGYVLMNGRGAVELKKAANCHAIHYVSRILSFSYLCMSGNLD